MILNSYVCAFISQRLLLTVFFIFLICFYFASYSFILCFDFCYSLYVNKKKANATEKCLSFCGFFPSVILHIDPIDFGLCFSCLTFAQIRYCLSFYMLIEIRHKNNREFKCDIYNFRIEPTKSVCEKWEFFCTCDWCFFLQNITFI